MTQLNNQKNDKFFAVKAEKLTITLGNRVILNNINIIIDKGFFCLLLGLMVREKAFFKAILGLIRPTSGRVTVNCLDTPPGYVPQERPIADYFPVTVRDILAMGFFQKSLIL